MNLFKTSKSCISNNWLNFLLLDSRYERDEVLNYTNKNKVMTRPIWQLMNNLPEFKKCQTDNLENSNFLQSRGVCLPSSVP